jgi:hypothetical protein
VGFRADFVFAEAMAAFALSLREGIVLFRNLLPRIARLFFRIQAPLFPVIVGRSHNRAPGDSTIHGAEYCSFRLVTVAVGVSAFTTVRS